MEVIRHLLVSGLATGLLCISVGAPGSDNNQATQAQLDAECEAARESKLAPERARFIEECVAANTRGSREACERFYRDHGARSGDRAPLYYDLPECKRAFEFSRSRRRR